MTKEYKRDEKGRFIATGVNPESLFNKRFVRRDDVQAMIDEAVKKAAGSVKTEQLQDMLDDAFLDGHKLGVRDGSNDKRMETFKAWKMK